MFEGEQITPKLRLVRPLGPEGKTHVWVAEHSGLGQNVAVKLMGRTLSRNSSPLHRFQREAEVASRQLKSPHFAQILEHGLTRSGMPYLVMELCEGEDLHARILRDGPMPPKDVVRIVGQLAKGLVKAHQLGLVHRNLKPGNIFLVPGEAEGEAQTKILDLGLSVRAGISSMGRTTSDATHMVSPEFLSPEQIFGLKDVDYRADLWAMAIVAYFALTGRTPFSAKNLEGFATAIEEGRFSPPSSIIPTLPPAVDAFFAKAFQRDPVARFSSATELAEELERALGTESEERTSRTSVPHAPPRGSLPSLTTSSARRPAMVSEKEISERLPTNIADPPVHPPPEAVTVTVSAPSSKGTPAVAIVVLALAGIGAIVAGLSLLSDGSTPPPPPPASLPSSTTTR